MNLLYSGYITDVEGIKVGHYEDLENLTGCSVIICEEGATGGIDVRGSAPGTRETDLFQDKKTVDKIHSVVLSGGSAFGLDASGGVMKYLEEKNVGFDTGIIKVPIVSSAVIFDLGLGNPHIRPDFNMGYLASKNSNNKDYSQGNVGAGAGASVGKILGKKFSMKSGLGSASVILGDLVVSAMVVVNAVGDVYNLKGKKIAGVYDYENSKFLDSIEIMKSGYINTLKGVNTTIGVVATNAILTKGQSNKVAEMAHNALAKRIMPVHTTFDGDTVFSLSTNKVEADVNLVGTLGIEAMEKAIVNSILSSKGVDNLFSFEDLNK